jgi:excisionase family DNA binding protein
MDSDSTHSPTKFEQLPDWLTPAEARQFLRLGKSSLYEKLRSGEIASRRFGRQFRIAKATLRPV